MKKQLTEQEFYFKLKYLSGVLNEEENKEEKYLYPKEIIKIIILGAMDKAIKEDKNYFSFIIVPVAMNFLGKCISKDKTFKINTNEKEDFNRFINELMPPKYKKVNEKIDLYSKLRNGMLNMLKPAKGLGLTHKSEAKKFKVKHLDIVDNSVVLVIEDLWGDVKKAANKVLKMKFSDNDKMNKEFISVPDND